MIEHAGKQFDDHLMRPFNLTKRLVSNFKSDEFEIFVTYGMPEGIGKSSYNHYVLADIAGYYACHDRDKIQWMWKKRDERPDEARLWELDWEGCKPYILYLPQDVVNLMIRLSDTEQRMVALEWDDAGTWLNAMDYQDPFVVAFKKYLSLARSSLAGIILSTPVEEWLLRSLRMSTGLIHTRVMTAPHSNDTFFWKPRLAKSYRIEKYIGRMKPYYNTVFEDLFYAITPDSFYDWYKPLRRHYIKEATEMMRKALDKRKKQKPAQVVKDSVILEDIAKANDSAEELLEIMR
jgi:hypothetical protein